MSRVEEEAVAGNPGGIIGIINKEAGVEHVDEIGSAISASRVSDLAFSTIEAERTRMLSAARFMTLVCLSFDLENGICFLSVMDIA